MKVVEFVDGQVLVLQVASRSRPGRKTHYLSLTYGSEGEVMDVTCSCEGFTFRGRCHHTADAEDLMGVTA